MYDKQKVTAILMAEVGYAEKETNTQLDDPTANAGDGNYTKYARDLAATGYYNTSKVGVAWCAVFVNWGPFKAFGKEAALALACQPHTDNCGAGCQSAYNYYKRKGQAHDGPPCEGDQIFFWNKQKTSRCHTGYVYAVDDTYVYTIEGNTSGASGVVDNGGAVCRKKYRLDYSRIAGYGRPDWGMEAKEPASTTDMAPSIPKVYNLGDRTLRSGSMGDDVRALQAALNRLPCLVTKLVIDGEFGPNTARAVYTFQNVYGITVDSKYGPESHKALMTALEELDKPADAPDEPDQSTAKKVVTIVSQKLVNLRNGDSLEAGCVTQVKGGTKLEYITTINGWHGVRWKNRIVWVSGQFSTVSEA